MSKPTSLLSAAELSALEKRLRDQASALKAEIRAHLGEGSDSGIVGLSSVPTETDDWGVGDELAARDIAEARQQLAALADVEGALGRIAAGSYGECVDCGEPIAVARLRAYPAATRCIDCQGALEKRAAGPPLTAV
ncbi:MAG TPA: TraR/DksA family transcriptional regulator [Casimicrobiaceae bacterium]|nr:TraR/DksA family transcriptional regulator [Casimicrobiaceae bacterium]